MTELADELSRRVSPARVKAEIREELRERGMKAKEAALKKTTEVRDRALASPTALGVLGGVIGVSIGAAVARRTRGSQYSNSGRHLREGYTAHADSGDVRLEPYGTEDLDVSYADADDLGGGARRGEYTVGSDYVGNEYTSDESPMHGAGGAAGLRDRVADKVGQLADQGREMKHRVVGQGQHVRERASGAMHRIADRVRDRAPSRESVRERASHLKDRASDVSYRARSRIEEQPLWVALGAVALGGLAALLIPVSRRERQAFRPIQDKVREKVESMGSHLETSIRGDGQASSGYAERGASDFEAQGGSGYSSAGDFSGSGAALGGLERSESSSDLGPSGGGVQSRPLEERKPEDRLGDVADPNLPSIH